MFETNKLVEKTKELVKIPSWKDEAEASNFIAELVDGETDEVGNVFASKGEGEKELALISHIDTVPPSGELEAYSENDRIYGRGSADMKGPLVAMALAFKNAEPNAKITFASFVGEETDARGVKHAINEGFSPNYSIIGEGTANYSEKDKMDVCVAHRGRKEVEIVTKGVSSHASQPKLGENAIYEMRDVLEKTKNSEPPSEKICGEEMELGSCVTKISSDGASNVVPNECKVTVDIRTIPNKEYKINYGDDKKVISDVPPMKTKEEKLVELLENSIKKETGYSPNRIIKPQATDAGFLAKTGSDTIILGPSEPAEPHSNNESISIQLLEDAYHTYLNILENFRK